MVFTPAAGNRRYRPLRGRMTWGRVPNSKMAYYQAREVLADVKAVWDADVTTPNPRYLGNPEHLNLQPVG